MLKSEGNVNNPWRMDSQQTLKKRSKWLQENRKDVEDKVKMMVQLIEVDADSFAQRAEIYYQKRPELVKQVEGFSQAYHSLAKHYEQFIGNIHPHSPPGVPLDSLPMSSGKHLRLKRSSNSFAGTINDSPSQSEQCDEGSSSNEHSADASHISCVEAKVCRPSTEQEESSAFSSGIEHEVANQDTEKFQEVLHNLKVENNDLVEASKRLVEECDAAKKLVTSLQQERFELQENKNLLTNETALLKDVILRLEEEVSRLSQNKIVMESEVRNGVATVQRLEIEIRLLQENYAQNKERAVAELKRLREVEGEFHKLNKEKVKFENDITLSAEREKSALAALRFLKGEAVCFLRKNKELEHDLSDLRNQKVTADISLVSKDTEISRLSMMTMELRLKLALIDSMYIQLQEDNNKHKSLLVDIAEEKRNAIGHLCFCIEFLEERIAKLKTIIRIYKSKHEELTCAIQRAGWKTCFTCQ